MGLDWLMGSLDGLVDWLDWIEFFLISFSYDSGYGYGTLLSNLK
jgi:hypothetical protein